MDSETFLLEALRAAPVIDTHEHLESEANRPENDMLVDYTLHYMNCDLISAGLNPKAIEKLKDVNTGIPEKWESVARQWEFCRTTGYGRMLDAAVWQLYGIERIDADSIIELYAKYRALRASPGYRMRILRDTCGIRHCVDNIGHLNNDTESGFFWFATQPDTWIVPPNTQFVQERCEASSIDDWANACVRELEQDFLVRGAKVIKLALAYNRSLRFTKPDRRAAQLSFERFLRGDTGGGRDMQDYMLHQVLRWANEYGRIVQIHTGFLNGNAGMLPDTNPEHLTELFLLYPRIRFDLFHMGYPYQQVMGALGKHFPNVFLNMCWAPILAPLVAERTLEEWLTSVPVNKIFAFGGDCAFYDGVVGSLEMTRRLVARVLTRQIDGGYLSERDALSVGKRLFYDNPAEFYCME